jgi:hypothetical protein
MPLANIPLTKDDFDRCGWREVIINCAEKECSSYYNLFFAKAREAETTGDIKAQELFILLGAITSLSLNLDSPNEPFRPYMMLASGSRSASLDDVSDSHLDVLKEIAPHVADAEMCARIADILWVKKRDFRMAGLAIDSYLVSASVLEHPEHWPPCVERVQRAMQLAALLGRKSQYFPKVIGHIESLLDKYSGDDALFPSPTIGIQAKLMTILQEQRQGSYSKYVALSEKIATHADIHGTWHKARTYWEIKAQWHVLDKDDANKRVALQRAAETYVQEAEAAITQPSSGYLAASTHLQKAVVALRRVGGMQARVNALHQRLLVYQRQAVKELKPFTAEIDLSEPIEKARQSVKGKTIPEALLMLACVCVSPKIIDLRNRVQEAVKNYPLMHFAPLVRMNQEGKVVERRPSMRSDKVDEAEAAMRSEMLSQAVTSQQLYAQVIEHVRHQILLEHSVCIDDLLLIVWNNPFIPEGREYIYARGLHAGFLGNFLDAAHLLIPQLENSIRYLLAQRGVIPSGIDAQGIQEEYTLSKIMYLPEIKAIFGEDVAFDLQGLLVEPAGSNIRNSMAHGLMNYDHFFSPQIVYLWWLTLRLCCLPILMEIHNNQGLSNQNTAPET